MIPIAKHKKTPTIVVPRQVSFHKTIKPPDPPTPPIFTLPNTPPSPASPSCKAWSLERQLLLNKVTDRLERIEIEHKIEKGEKEEDLVSVAMDDNSPQSSEPNNMQNKLLKKKDIGMIDVSNERSKKPTKAKEWRLQREKRRNENKS